MLPLAVTDKESNLYPPSNKMELFLYKLLSCIWEKTDIMVLRGQLSVKTNELFLYTSFKCQPHKLNSITGVLKYYFTSWVYREELKITIMYQQHFPK